MDDAGEKKFMIWKSIVKIKKQGSSLPLESA
jgi:hypothetical protein